jgi:hypothetical protein
VPFDLGRPLGAANEPAFQRRVLIHALALLEAPIGPVLEAFPEDAPQDGTAPVQVACPVNFRRATGSLAPMDQLLEAFLTEVSQMAVWFDQARQKRKRTTFGLTGLDPEHAAQLMAEFVRGHPVQSIMPNTSTADALRMAAEDIKAAYLEAVSALPGQCADHQHLADWFWRETNAAVVIDTIRRICLKSKDESLLLLGKLLLGRAINYTASNDDAIHAVRENSNVIMILRNPGQRPES